MNKVFGNIVLVGLMGAGKTRIGQELARQLKRPFFDSDKEIEAAAGLSIPEIFARLGETEFRRGEKQVILRLLARDDQQVIATGGGAFMQEDIRQQIKNRSVSVWLRARVETLVERASRTDHRPLLRGVDKKAKLEELIALRYPVYAEADIVIDTDDCNAAETARLIRQRLATFTPPARG